MIKLNQKKKISYQSFDSDQIETNVRLFFVDVANIDESLGELREKLREGIHKSNYFARI